MKLTFVFTVGLLWLATAAQAVPIGIRNANFDDQGTSGDGLSDTGQIADWIESVNDIVGDDQNMGRWNPDSARYPSTGGTAPSGETVGYINNSGAIGLFRIKQFLEDASSNPILVAPNQVYTISLMYGRRIDDLNPPPESNPGILEVSILESGSNAVLASATYNSSAQGLGTFTAQVFDLAVGATPAGQGNQAILSLRNMSTGSQANFDNLVGSVDVVDPLTPGDFDSDGDVDGADFVVWQTNFPKSEGGTLDTGDADGDGDVDGADFVVWQTNFPFTPGSGASPVPEPQTLVLAVLGWMIAVSWRRRS